jgi:hypothetical protein
MKKDWIPFELALELKQLGFDEPCSRFYLMYLPAPTFSQAFRWFREKHLLEGLVLPQDRSIPDPLPIYFIAVISYEDGGMNELFNSTAPINTLHYSDYEEAELACLKKLIDIAKSLNI